MMTTTCLPELQLTWNDGTAPVDLAPLQGTWTEEQYLKLTDHARRLLEFSDGELEVLPMPTDKHQALSQFIFLALLAYMQRIGGKVHYAPIRIQIRPGKYREPDLLLLLDARDPRRQNRYWLGADLVVEVVSPDNPERDTVAKRDDYAEGRIPEYWIVNPDAATITVLTLDGDAYREHGVFGRGTSATSPLLAGFTLAVDAVLDAE